MGRLQLYEARRAQLPGHRGRARRDGRPRASALSDSAARSPPRASSPPSAAPAAALPPRSRPPDRRRRRGAGRRRRRCHDALSRRAPRRRGDAGAGAVRAGRDHARARRALPGAGASTSSSSRAAAAASRTSCRSATSASSVPSQAAPSPSFRRRPRAGRAACDLAADVRAATPTAAARLVSDLDELRAWLERAPASRRRDDPALERDRARLGRSRERLVAAPGLLVERRRAALDPDGVRLQALSPRATLARGYAIVRAAGTVVRDASTVPVGDPIDVELATGGLAARVEEVRK